MKMLTKIYTLLVIVVLSDSSRYAPHLEIPGNSIRSFSVDVKSLITAFVSNSDDLIATTISPSVSRCLIDCHYTGSCESVNFNTRDGECKMYRVESPLLAQMIGHRNQFATRHALKLPTPFDSCDVNDCAAGDRCVPVQETGYSCLAQPRTLETAP